MQSDEDREYETARSKYSASFMSNTKWLRLFSAVIESGLKIEYAEWRVIGSDRSFWEPFPTSIDLLPTRFSDGRFQLLEYRWLESVFIPSGYKPTSAVGYERKQDTVSLVAVLATAGQFQVEESIGGVTVHAYRKQTAA